MRTISGTASHVSTIDNGRRIGFFFRETGGRTAYLVADDAAAGSAVAFRIRNAANMGDTIELEIEPIPPRLGAPDGRAVSLRTTAFAGVRIPLCKAA